MTKNNECCLILFYFNKREVTNDSKTNEFQ